MSTYSELLYQYIEEKGIKVAKLIEYCDLDRSSMYKIIKGKRKPASIDVVRKIANYMQLSPNENELYYKAYYTTLLGEESYEQNRLIHEFIYDFNYIYNKKPMIFEGGETSLEVIDDSPVHMCKGRAEINYYIKCLLKKAVSQKSADIMLITQCDNQYLMDTLLYLGKNIDSMKIKHILCFQKKGKHAKENIGILKKLIPFYGCECSYEPYYYYDEVNSHFYNMNLFCNVLICSEGVLCYTSDYKYGQILRDSECIEVYKQIFKEYLEQAYPLLTKVESIVQEYLSIGQDVLKMTTRAEAYALHADPCAVPFITDEVLERAVKESVPQREQVLGLFSKYIREEKAVLDTGNFKCNFTLGGIENFIKSGRISEIPDDFYDSIEEKDCVDIIKMMIPYFENGTYRILKNQIADIKSNLHIFVSFASSHLIFSKNSKELVYIYLNEPEIIQCFMGFMESLNEDESLHTPEEAVMKVSEVIQKYEE